MKEKDRLHLSGHFGGHGSDGALRSQGCHIVQIMSRIVYTSLQLIVKATSAE